MTEVDSSLSDDPLVGTLVDNKYRIVRLCGRGGMGAVYEALHVAIGKRVALKFIDAQACTDSESVQRFLREAQAASAAESHHIVQVFDVGELSPGRPYIVMELLLGEPLSARLARMGRLPATEALSIVVHTLRGLKRAHEVGIVHRDLKPENIFLVETDDDPIFGKVVDFGISKIVRAAGTLTGATLTREGVILGTPYYMSPEQAQGLPDLDARTDLWAVGMILFECLTGCRPHRGNTYEQVIIAICTVDAPDVRTLAPEVPARVAEIVQRALVRDRDKRFQSAVEFLDAIRAVAPELARSQSALFSDGAAQVLGKSAQAASSVRPEAASGAKTRVSWETGRNAARDSESTHDRNPIAAASRRRVALVAGTSLFVALVATFAMVRRPKDAPGEAARGGVVSSVVWESSARTLPVDVRIVAVPSAATVLVDDKLSADAVVRGRVGDAHRVRVQADGYQPVERTLVLSEVERDVHIELDAFDGGGVDAGRSKATIVGGKSAGPGGTGPPRPASPGGIAGGLKLKTDGP